MWLLIKNSTSEIILGIKIDNKLSFDGRVKNTYKKANGKLLARATPYMEIGKRKLILNTFFNAHFNYFPIVWMIHICLEY